MIGSGVKAHMRSRLESLLKKRRTRNFVFRTIHDDGGFIYKDFDDHRLVFNPAEYVGRTLFDTGNFNRSETEEAIRRSLAARETPGDVFLEIGANIGTQTVYASLTHGFRRYVVIEPDPDNLSILRANLQLNGLESATSVAACAVSDQTGSARLVRHGLNSGAGAIHDDKIKTLDQDAGFVDVPLRTADSVLAECGVSASELAVVWIDTEGH